MARGYSLSSKPPVRPREVRVRDTGIGIAPDKLEHIFGEFSQADDTTTRRFGGTGLGLAITHHFVQLLGGSITVRSELGEGSEFELWLPSDLPKTEE